MSSPLVHSLSLAAGRLIPFTCSAQLVYSNENLQCPISYVNNGWHSGTGYASWIPWKRHSELLTRHHGIFG